VGAAVVLIVAALAVSIVIGMLRTSAAPPVEEIPVVPSVDASIELYVHVSGAVRRPGLYRMKSGARVVDAVAAAGGFTRKADSAGVNLARPVTDGEQLHIAAEGDAAESPSAGRDGAGGGSAGAPSHGLVNLNTADSGALETLPRIGPALASRIIAWREQNGRFTSVDDLLAVPGIGAKLLEGLRDAVTV